MNASHSSILAAAIALGFAGAAAAHDDGHMGHGGHAHGPTAFDAGEPGKGVLTARRIEVVAREGDGKMLFEPSKVDVRKGETVEFVVRNEGHLEHEFVLGSMIENASHAAMMVAVPDMKHDDPNGVRVKPGTSAGLVWRFSKAGKFEFACLIPGHYEAGMKGDLAVQ